MCRCDPLFPSSASVPVVTAAGQRPSIPTLVVIIIPPVALRSSLARGPSKVYCTGAADANEIGLCDAETTFRAATVREKPLFAPGRRGGDQDLLQDGGERFGPDGVPLGIQVQLVFEEKT